MIFWQKFKIQDASHSVEISLNTSGAVVIPNLKTTTLSVSTLANAITLPTGSNFAGSTTLPAGTTFDGPITIPASSTLSGTLTLPSSSALTMSGHLRLNKLTMQTDDETAPEVDFSTATVALDGTKTKLNNLSLSEWIGSAIEECRCAIPNGIAFVTAWDNDVYIHPLLPTNLRLKAEVSTSDGNKNWSWAYNTNSKRWVATTSESMGSSNSEWSHIDRVNEVLLTITDSSGNSIEGSNTLWIQRNAFPSNSNAQSTCFFIPIALFFNNKPNDVPQEYKVNNYYCPGPVAASAETAVFIPLTFNRYSTCYNRASIMTWALSKFDVVYGSTSIFIGHSEDRNIYNSSAKTTTYEISGFIGLGDYLVGDEVVSNVGQVMFYKE